MNEINPIKTLEKMAKECGSRLALANKLGISSAYLSDVMNERRNVTDKILKKIGLKRITIERNGSK